MKTTLLLLMSAALAVVWTGCESTDQYVLKNEPVQTFRADGFSITAQFLSAAELQRRYGEKANPFLPPDSIQNTRMMVFELIISADSQPLSFKRDKMELMFGGNPKIPTSENYLSSFWEQHTDLEREDTSSLRNRERIIGRQLLPHTFSVAQGSIRKGLIVFLGSMPSSGTAVLNIPVSEGSGSTRAGYTFQF